MNQAEWLAGDDARAELEAMGVRLLTARDAARGTTLTGARIVARSQRQGYRVLVVCTEISYLERGVPKSGVRALLVSLPDSVPAGRAVHAVHTFTLRSPDFDTVIEGMLGIREHFEERKRLDREEG